VGSRSETTASSTSTPPSTFALGTLERVQAGESASAVADATGVPSLTIFRLYDERRDFYFAADPADECVDAALEEIRPIEDLTPDADEFEARVRNIVRNELSE
jgi:hypothetical protein